MWVFLQRWEYMHVPDPKSKEGQLIDVLKNPRDWLEIGETISA